MADIKAILESNDIAGVVILHTPGFSEYLNHLQTSYSCAVVAPDGIRLKLSEKEVGRDRAMQLANDTFNMVHHLTRVLTVNASVYIDCYELLKKKWNGSIGRDGGHTSHEQQNN